MIWALLAHHFGILGHTFPALEIVLGKAQLTGPRQQLLMIRAMLAYHFGKLRYTMLAMQNGFG